MATYGVRCRRKNKVGGLTPLAVKMASRTQEIRPVGAWVEPYTQYDCSAVVSYRVWMVILLRAFSGFGAISSGHCKRYRATGPHRATGPESTWT